MIKKNLKKNSKNSLLIFFFLLLIFPLINADIITPTLTKVYFEKDGKPYDQPVSFTVNCYGYTFSPGSDNKKEPGTYTPEKVFSFSATVQKYGETIFEDYYMNYRHIDYCDIEGETNEGKFFIEKYSNSPINFSKCERIKPHYDDKDFYDYERICELRVDITKNIVKNNEPISQSKSKGFLSKIYCFFRKIFKLNC